MNLPENPLGNKIELLIKEKITQEEIQEFIKLQIVSLYLKGYTVKTISNITNQDRSTVYRWLARYNRSGLDEFLQKKIKIGRPNLANKIK